MPRMVSDVPVRDVALWCLRRGVSLPAPLSGGSTTRVELTREDILAASQTRLLATNGAVRQPSVLDRCAHVLLEPQWSVWAGRSADTDNDLLVVGLVRGDQAVVVVEHETTWRVLEPPVERVVEFVVDALPARVAARIAAVAVSTRSVLDAGAEIAGSGVVRRGRGALATRGVDTDVATVLERIHSTETARGIISATSFGAGSLAYGVDDDITWFESAAGSVLTRRAGATTHIEPATSVAMRLAAGRASDGARRSMTSMTRQEGSEVGAR